MAADYKNFIVERRDDGIAICKVDRPTTKNALNKDCWIELRDILIELQEDDQVRVIILASAIPGVFIAGADIKEFMNTPPVKQLFSMDGEAIRTVDKLRKPTIAAVGGAAYGGGLELALACDIRVVSESAIMGLPETGLGVMPGLGGTQRLARIVGVGRAKEVILAGRTIKGSEAVPMGLAMTCVSDGELLDEAVHIAQRICLKGPTALYLAKRCINNSFSTGYDEGLFIENLGFCTLLESEEMREGTAAFLEKRKPQFNLRRDESHDHR